MPLVEDLLMLLLDDETGRPEVRSPELDGLLAGAAVADFVLEGVLVPQGDGRLLVRREPPGRTRAGRHDPDPLVGRLPAEAAQDRVEAVSALVPHVLEPTVQRLVERGLVDARPAGRFLWLGKGQRWPATAAGRGDGGLLERLGDVAAGRAPGDERDLVLIALLRAAGQDVGVDPGQADAVVSRSPLAAWIGPAVRSAMDARAAAMAATQAVQAANTVTTAVIT